MKEQTRVYCEAFIENRDAVKKEFSLENGMAHLACAAVYAAENKRVAETDLKNAKALLKKNVGLFSNFRGTAKMPIISMLAASENPEQVLEDGLKIYGMLKKKLHASEYMAYAAITVARLAEAEQYENIVLRTEKIYKGLKAEHPFLTSKEDDAMCVLMAMSDKADDVLLAETENCYCRLKGQIASSNPTLSLACVLALYDGAAESKCERTIALYEAFREAGCKYGKEYELPTLGVLAMAGGSIEELVADVAEIDKWLAGQKGFGVLGSVNKKQRLMYAGFLAQKEASGAGTMQTTAVNGTISMLIAQQMAMCAVIAASSAAAASAASN